MFSNGISIEKAGYERNAMVDKTEGGRRKELSGTCKPVSRPCVQYCDWDSSAHRKAEDVTQEVFVEVFRSVARFKGECSISTWIYRITVQEIAGAYPQQPPEKTQRDPPQSLRKENQLNISEDIPFYHPGIRLENKERAAVLFSASQKLPPKPANRYYPAQRWKCLSTWKLRRSWKIRYPPWKSLTFRARKTSGMLSDYYKKTNNDRQGLITDNIKKI